VSGERVFSDADLHAYLDGELSAEDRRELDAWLTDSPEARERLQRFAADRALLRDALEPVLREPVPAAMTAAVNDALPRRGTRNWRRAAAALAIFALGALAGWSASQQLQPRLAGAPAVAEQAIAEQAIDAHLVYLPEVRHPVEVGADERDHLVTWLSRRLGHPLTAPDLSEAGFRLMGGRLLPAGGGAGAQFMYEDGEGERLTLLIAVNPEGRQTAFRLMARDGTRTFYWFDGPFGYALTGAIAEETLLRLARSIYAQLEESRPEG
jgi:anti-sigma factor RsiW